MSAPEELRELDERIAEAKGWRPHPQDGRGWQHPSDRDVRGGGIVVYTLKRYSTSIEAAWELVEEMKADPLATEVDLNNQGGWTFDVYRLPGVNDVFQHEPFATAPEAISRAWLAWKEAQE